MAVIGFASTSPSSIIQMLDKKIWDIAVWAGSPKMNDRYYEIARSKSDKRRVQLVMGIGELGKLKRKAFQATLIFDTATNLERLRNNFESFEIVDIKELSPGVYTPKPVSLAKLHKLLEADSNVLPKNLPTFCDPRIFSTAAAVLETTTSVSATKSPPGKTGMGALLSELVSACGGSQWVPGVYSEYCKYLFHLCTRSYLTSSVTRKLPSKEAKEIWKRLCDIADSDVGYAFYSAFYKLCRTKSPKTYNIDSAIVEFGLTPYAGDFLWATSIISPSPAYEFLVDLGHMDREKKADDKSEKKPKGKANGKTNGKTKPKAKKQRSKK